MAYKVRSRHLSGEGYVYSGKFRTKKEAESALKKAKKAHRFNPVVRTAEVVKVKSRRKVRSMT